MQSGASNLMLQGAAELLHSLWNAHPFLIGNHMWPLTILVQQLLYLLVVLVLGTSFQRSCGLEGLLPFVATLLHQNACVALALSLGS